MIVLIGLLCTKLVGANFEHVYSRRVGSVVLIGSNLFFPVTKWIRKNRQMSIKVAQNDFTSKMMILTPLQKCLIMWGGFGQINCCQRLKKVAKSSINRPIWSHCLQPIGSEHVFDFSTRWSYTKKEKTIMKKLCSLKAHFNFIFVEIFIYFVY